MCCFLIPVSIARGAKSTRARCVGTTARQLMALCHPNGGPVEALTTPQTPTPTCTASCATDVAFSVAASHASRRDSVCRRFTW